MYPLVNGNNLGKLSKEEIVNLYTTSDIGVVASMTNISLVPYEMIATGLPIIEFQDGSYSNFLSADSALLADFNANSIGKRIIEMAKSPESFSEMNAYARKQISNLSWDRTAHEFLDILQEVCQPQT